MIAISRLQFFQNANLNQSDLVPWLIKINKYFEKFWRQFGTKVMRGDDLLIVKEFLNFMDFK